MRAKHSPGDDEDGGSSAAALAAAVLAPLTDRVNTEPPILNGMTASEAQIIGTAAFAFWLFVGGVLAWTVGVWQVMLATAIVGPMVTVWIASTRLARIKRNRPDGYYRQAINVWLAARGLRSPVFIDHDGHWELGRSLDLSLVPGKRRAG